MHLPFLKFSSRPALISPLSCSFFEIAFFSFPVLTLAQRSPSVSLFPPLHHVLQLQGTDQHSLPQHPLLSNLTLLPHPSRPLPFPVDSPFIPLPFPLYRQCVRHFPVQGQQSHGAGWPIASSLWRRPFSHVCFSHIYDRKCTKLCHCTRVSVVLITLQSACKCFTSADRKLTPNVLHLPVAMETGYPLCVTCAHVWSGFLLPSISFPLALSCQILLSLTLSLPTTHWKRNTH